MTQTIAERLREIADSNERSAFDLQGREAQENPFIRALAWKLQSDCATLRGIAAELDAKADELVSVGRTDYACELAATLGG